MSDENLVKQELKEGLKTKDIILYKVIYAIWTVSLLLKLICQDEEWGLFLMVTALLLLYLFPVFLKYTNIAVKDSSTAISADYALLYTEEGDKKATEEKKRKT